MIMFCVGMPNFRKITRSKFENYRYFQQCSIIWSSNSASDRFFTTVMDGIGRHVDLFHPQFRSPKTSTYSIPSNFWLFAPPPKQVFSKVGTNQYFKAWYHSLNNSDFVLFWVDIIHQVFWIYFRIASFVTLMQIIIQLLHDILLTYWFIIANHILNQINVR